MRKTIEILILATIALGFIVSARHAWWWGRITEGKFALIGNIEFWQQGNTNFALGPEGERVFLYTNIVHLTGTNYPCILGLDMPAFKGKGILAMTTNRTFLWIGSDGKLELK